MKKDSMHNDFHIDYGPICHLYAQEQLTGTLYLAFRDIPHILQRYSLFNREYQIKALDFGCGTGVSTRYLRSLESLFKKGINPQGVDINRDMLSLARQGDKQGVYHLLQHQHIPFPDSFYDLIFSTFVLFEFASKEKMGQALKEIKRVMKKDGILIAVTGSVETYNGKNEWVSLKVNFPQNEHLKSGELGRVDFVINDQVLTFQNYYWTEADYQEVFQKAGLHLCETLYPLGNQEEEKRLSWKWKSEVKVSPYYIFVLQKTSQ